MKIKAILAILVGAVAINGATAGEWCPPAPSAKDCPVDDCCPDSGGSLAVGYTTDYIWKGVRISRDWVWTDVNYTFDGLPVSPTIGIYHGTSLSSNNPLFGDWTQLYANVGLPCVMGVNASLGYRYNLFPTLRQPTGARGNGGDSFSEVSLSLSKDIACGLTATYTGTYLLGQTNRGNVDLSAWYHELGVEKSICLTDCIGMTLGAGVAYSDGLWSGLGFANTGSGWNHYYVTAGLPIALKCNATVTPYIGYNGTPGGWVAGNAGTPIAGANAQDALYGGISVRVSF